MHVKYGKEIDHKIPNNIRGNVCKSTKSSVVLTLHFLGYSTKLISSLLFVFTQQVIHITNNNNNNNNNNNLQYVTLES
jgi:Holliday junction resolvasome RuvABC DNA-binding subunit